MNLMNRIFQFSPAPSTPTKPPIVCKNKEGTVYSQFPVGNLLETTPPIHDPQREFVSYYDSLTEREEIIMVIRGFFSLPECRNIVSNSEELGLEDISQLYSPDYRNNTRVMVEVEDFVDIMYERLKPHLAAYTMHSRESVGENCWNSCDFSGLNPRLRICKYEAGGVFQRHRDGACVLPKKKLVSHLTVMAYLNTVDKVNGGATRFFGLPPPPTSETVTCMLASVQPEEGMLVVFPHVLCHDGEALAQGTKYILRTDVLQAMDQSTRDEVLW